MQLSTKVHLRRSCYRTSLINMALIKIFLFTTALMVFVSFTQAAVGIEKVSSAPGNSFSINSYNYSTTLKIEVVFT